MKIQKKDSERIRELATSVSEIAKETRMEKILKRWRDVNALRKPDRAPVWCRPVGCWKEIIPDSKLLCTEPWLINIEWKRHKYIFLVTVFYRGMQKIHPQSLIVDIQTVQFII